METKAFKAIVAQAFALPPETRLMTVSAAWLIVSSDELTQAFKNGEFEQARERQLKLLENIKAVVRQDPDLEILRLGTEMEKAIEESNLDEIERIQKEFLEKLE